MKIVLTSQLISPIKDTDNEVSISRGAPVLFFSKKFSNTKIAKYFGV